MKQIYFVILAAGLLVLPGALSGQIQKDGSAAGDGAKKQEASVTSADRCGTPEPMAYERPKGKCSCEIITGARVSGCTATNELDCDQQTCTYQRLDLRTGEVIEEGNMECVWTPFYPS